MTDLTQKNNNYPYYSDATLTQHEIEMRNFLMYDFNISLKSMLIKYNFEMLDMYYFNTCRQTAVFGALVLNKFYPEYTYEAYEAKFDDTLLGRPVQYEHCFIIAEHKEIPRRILIDMARTTNPLVFEPVDENHFYPDIEAYKDLKMLSYEEIPYNQVFDLNITEFLTGLPTQSFYEELLEFMENYKNSTADKDAVVQKIYSYPFLKFEKLKAENILEER
jgi:hypothetical protein